MSGRVMARCVGIILLLVAVRASHVGTSARAQGQTVAVSVLDNSYNPEPFTIAPGTTVIWTNRGGIAHTVTSDDPAAEPFDSNVLKPGQSYRYTFNTVGVFTYHCSFHDNMLGTVIVEPPGVTTPLVAPTSTPRPAMSTVTPSAAQHGVTATVHVVTHSGGSLQFTPAVLNVSIGTRVTWKNQTLHSQAIASRTWGWVFSRTIQKKGAASYRFAVTGRYTYSDVTHPKTRGRIIVHAAR